ncbi:MAG TPA: subclass B3 metallo-beta-lactamase [Myxococcaceae bacterium]|jgi:metallo-beta-lactamase class B
MTLKTPLFAAILAALLCAPAFAQKAPSTPAAKQPSQREIWNAPAEPFHVIDKVYSVGPAGLAAYLFKTQDGLILLDGALPESASQIEANIQKLGFKLSDVKILLNSHAHFDHSGGLAQLKKATGAKLYAMDADASALEGGVYVGSESDKSLSAPPVKVDKVLRDGDTVSLGGVTLKAHLTPGHSPGCTSWGQTVQHQGKSYELLVFCSATVAANRITPPLQYPGIVEAYRKTFAKSKAMKVDVFLAPHPEFFDMAGKRAKLKDGAPNPFINPGEFQPFIEKLEASFEKTLAERTAAMKPAKP